jgi:integrase
VGSRGVAWQFFHQRRDHGRRVHTFKTLGTFPQTNSDAARKAAAILAGNVAAGNAPQAKGAGVRFETAFEDYCDYLERKALAKGKPPRWARNVRQLGKQLLLPRWRGWTLAEMSERPDAVEEWHRNAVKSAGPTSANHAARVLRALYRRRAKRDLALSKANIPTAAVEMHNEKREQKGLAIRDFPKWFAAWRIVESPVHRAYHMVNLLTGARPGELSRTRWQDVDPRARTLTIGDAKAGNDIPVPLTVEIVAALRLARDAQPKAKRSDLIFPGCNQVGHRSELPARGHALRRTFKTVATTRCNVPDDVSAFLLGHVPEGMSQKYLLRWAMSSGRAIRDAQRKISHEIALLLQKKKSGALQ